MVFGEVLRRSVLNALRVLNENNCQTLGQMPLDVTVEHPNTWVVSLETVSYTHLDVYKRQMWYNTPLKYRALARERCETLGYFGHVDDEDQPDQPDQQLDSLVQSQAFKATQASKARNADLLKSARYNLQYLTRLGEQVTNWLVAMNSMATVNSST